MIETITLTEDCQAIKLRDVKIGDVFKRKPAAKKVYARCRAWPGQKTISGMDVDDISREISLNPNTIVYIGFTY